MANLKNIFNRHFKGDKQKPSDHGLASIVIVLMLTIVLTLLSLGFSKLMDRAARQALTNNQGEAAELAAQSGINDVASLIKSSADYSSDTCKGLFGVDAHGVPQPYSGSAANLSLNGNTRYTCVLLNRTPSDIKYQNILPYKSQVIVLAPYNKPIERLMLSWQSSDPDFGAYPTGINPKPGVTYPPMLDETTWSQNKYVPFMRLTLYRIPKTLASNKIEQETLFLYPTQAQPGASTQPDPSTVAVDKIDDGNDPDLANDGTAVRKIKCGASKTGVDFTGPADYDCNFILYNLSTKLDDDNNPYYYYFVRVTPFYDKADIKIQANDKSTPHAVVDMGASNFTADVTAKSGSAVKRLQASIDRPFSGVASSTITSGDDLVPEYALQTSNTICKHLLRIKSPGAGQPHVVVDNSDGNATACNMGWMTATALGPRITFYADDYSVKYTDMTELRWQVVPGTNNAAVTSCQVTASPSQSGFPYTVPVSNIDNGHTHSGTMDQARTFTITCKDAQNNTSVQSMDISVVGPPTTEVAFYPEKPSVPRVAPGNSTNLDLDMRGQAGSSNWCYGTGGTPFGAGRFLTASEITASTDTTTHKFNTGALSNDDKHNPKPYTYTIQCGNNSSDYVAFYDADGSNTITVGGQTKKGWHSDKITAVVQVDPLYPLPKVQFTAKATTIDYNKNAQLSWVVSNGPANWCWATSNKVTTDPNNPANKTYTPVGPWSNNTAKGTSVSVTGDSVTTSALSSGNYQFTMECGNNSSNYQDLSNSEGPGYHTPIQTVSVTVRKPPKVTIQIAGNKVGDKVTSSSDDGGINCSYTGTGQTGVCSHSFGSTTKIVLKATPASGSRISDWNGPCSLNDTGDNCTVNINDDITIKVTFAPQ